MGDGLSMCTGSGQDSGDCPQALGNFIAGALATNSIGREAGRLNTSIEPNTARSLPHRVRGFQHSTYVSPRRRHAVRSRRRGIRDEVHPRHARRRAHTHHLRADHNPWGAAPCFFLLFFFTEAHRTRGGSRPVIWCTAKPIADMPGKALDPRRRVKNAALDAVLAVGRQGGREGRERVG